MSRRRTPRGTRSPARASDRRSQQTAFIFPSMNAQRAVWAERAVLTFCHVTGLDAGTEQIDGYRDLLCNLGHYADWAGLDFEVELQGALTTWREEKADPFENGSEEVQP